MITRKELHQALDALELSHSDLCLHSSMRSLGDRLEDGPEILVEVLLERGCTVLVPAFSSMFLAEPPGGGAPEDGAVAFHPACKEISVEKMGIVASYVLHAPGSVRGDHPLNSFAALGPHAAELVAGQTPQDVYAPFRQLYERDGDILLAGVSLDRATVIHYAEQLAGRRPFVRWARRAGRGTIAAAVGGCSRGFDRLAPALEPFRRRVAVGQSLWSRFRVRDIVDVSKEEIGRDPQITHCGDFLCDRCNDAVWGGPAASPWPWND